MVVGSYGLSVRVGYYSRRYVETDKGGTVVLDLIGIRSGSIARRGAAGQWPENKSSEDDRKGLTITAVKRLLTQFPPDLLPRVAKLP